MAASSPATERLHTKNKQAQPNLILFCCGQFVYFQENFHESEFNPEIPACRVATSRDCACGAAVSSAAMNGLAGFALPQPTLSPTVDCVRA
jgi:hypothetical protein